MTNIENQKARNNEKWYRSEQFGEDLSGKMPWCLKCQFRTSRNTCNTKQERRDAECLCGKAYNRMKRAK